MSRRPNIIHIGGEKCVTGSCHLLQVKGLNIMVDCGLTQGHDAGAPTDSWPVRPDQLDFLFLTHAHIDHIGRLPELIQKGFKGEIIATHATKALLEPMLSDEIRSHISQDDTILLGEEELPDEFRGFSPYSDPQLVFGGRLKTLVDELWRQDLVGLQGLSTGHFRCFLRCSKRRPPETHI